MSELTVRPIEPDDYDVVISMWEKCFPHRRDYSKPAADLRRKLAHEDDMLLVGTLDEEVVATVMVGYDGHRGWIYYLAVHPDNRRKGLGRKMLLAAETRLKRRGCTKLNLQVLGENTQVIAFYERMGFAVEQRISLGKRLES